MFKKIAAAAVLSMALPISAYADTIMMDGGVYDISTDNEFSFADNTQDDGGDGYFTFGFESGGVPGALAFNLIFDPVNTNLDEFTAIWSSGANGTGTVYNSATVDASSGLASIFDFAADFSDSDPQWLSVTWSTISGIADAEVVIEVAPVPLPAAGFLLLGGLGGLAVARRRKKS